MAKTLLSEMMSRLDAHTGEDETGNAKPPLPVREIKDMAASLKNIQHVGRLALGQSVDIHHANSETSTNSAAYEMGPVRLVVTDPEVMAEAQRILERTIENVDASNTNVPPLLPPDTDSTITGDS